MYAFIGGIFAIVTRHPLLVKSTRQAGIATCVLIFLGTLSLEYLFFSDDFSLAYVVAHSNRDLAAFYKFAALWAGQEGSLLFWSFLLAIYVFSVLLAYRNKNGELMPYVGVILAGVQIFFLMLNNFVANPFKALAAPGAAGVLELVTRMDGNGLNRAAAVSGDGDSPAEPVFGVYRIHDSVCVCVGSAAGAVSRREMDSPDAQMDDDGVGFPVVAESCWARTGPMRCWAGAAIGAGTRWRMRRCCRG